MFLVVQSIPKVKSGASLLSLPENDQSILVGGEEMEYLGNRDEAV
jgi:hypothetical protein